MGTFGFPFMYTGELMDANDLVYLRARYYHPGLGVFPSLDPVENLNRYQYVDSNPTNFVDPSGLQKNCPWWYRGHAVDLIPDPRNHFAFAYLQSSDCMECTSLCVTINQNCLTGDRGFLLGTDQIHGDIWGMSECKTNCGRMFPGQNCYPGMEGPSIDLESIFCSTPLGFPICVAPEVLETVVNAIKPKNTEFVLGVRLDASLVDLIGGDVNLEYYCTGYGWIENFLELAEHWGLGKTPDLGGRCGYFLNLGFETGTIATAGTNVGGLIGFTSFPDEPGEYTFVFSGGGSAAAGLGIEGDITVNPSDRSTMLFIGAGGGGGGGVYGDIAISIYLGETDEEANQMLLEIISHLDDYWFPNME